MMALLETATRPLGQLLIERGLLSEEDLKNALALQQERRDKLGKILIDLGYVAEREVLNVVIEQLKVQLFMGEYPPVTIVAASITYRFIRAFLAISILVVTNM